MQFNPRTLLRILLYTTATLVIVMALLVGAVRLMLPLVPDYQDDIRAWASAATGYEIAFGGMSAGWPLSGPELSFIDVRLTLPGESQPVVEARGFSVGLSIFRSLRDGRLQPGRVAVHGSRLRMERLADGSLLVQGHRLAELLPGSSAERPELDLELDDIAFSLVDPRRQPEELSLQLRWLRAGVRHDKLSTRLSLGLPADLGQQLDAQFVLSLPLPEAPLLPDDWEVHVNGTGLELPRLLAYAVGAAGALEGGHGDVDARLGFRRGRAQQAALTLDLRGVTVTAGEATDTYERIAGRAQWQRSATGWDAMLGELRVRRNGMDSPLTTGEFHKRKAADAEADHWSASAGFLRLDDLFPLARAALAGTTIAPRLPQQLAGDLRAVSADLAVGGGQTQYSLRLDFAGMALANESGAVAASGLTGRLAADNDGGRLELDSHGVAIGLDEWFRSPLPADSLQGMVVWRRAPEGIRFLSDDIRIKTAAIAINSRLELMFPADGGSPVLDLKARASASEAPQVLRYLPLRHFPPEVGDWLERAVVAGRVPVAEGVFRGPLQAFPFDEGEGQFRISMHLEQGTLDYADGWPPVEDLDAEVVFDGASLSSVRNRARLGRLAVEDFVVRIPDMRVGVLTVAGEERVELPEVLQFLRATPVAEHVGPVLQRASAAGSADAALRLVLPLTDTAAWDLDLLLDPRGARLALAGLPLDLRDVRGRIRLQNTDFHAEGVRALMLGEPVRIGLAPETGARGRTLAQLVKLAGATPVPRLISTFGLPLREYFAGELDWQATVRIPGPDQGATVDPLTVAIDSGLRGVTSSLPAPLAKQADDTWPTRLGLAFPEHDVIDVTARLQPAFAAALRLTATGESWHIERGALRAGPGMVTLPSRRGVEVSGQLADIDVDDWLAVGEADPAAGDGRGFRDIFRNFVLDADRVVVAGQVFRQVRANVRRGANAWQVAVNAPSVVGDITVPFDAGQAMQLDMQRLWLGEEDKQPGGRPVDPRALMALEAKVADAAIGEWRLGQLDLVVARTDDGLGIERLAARTPSFTISGSGGWHVLDDDPARQESRLQATLESTDVGATLDRLGFGSNISGRSARVQASLAWPGGPSGDFLQRASGRIAVAMKSGQVSEVEPGGGRLVGLLSVTALPRRLSLDFHDVFDKGLSYDLIEGDFSLGGGGAYTCNLGLSSPAVEIGIIGRTALDERSYDQMAVVRPQLATTVLTAGGAVLGGPVGGVTMLLISQMFRKTLGSLGESYYRVTGSWDEPSVVRVQGGEVDAAAFRDCEKEIEAALRTPSNAPQPAPQQPLAEP